MEEALAQEPGSGCKSVATDKRQAWAQSRDSWQASEAEDAAPPVPLHCLGLTAETGHIPNEKIATWLKDCRTPLGASLDEQNNPKGILMKNGGSFEDDLSLGAEANHLHHNSKQMESACNGMLAKDRRLEFHQKGRSMNSTGSGKSSTTVSSVSELLDLYEEDPEEILYNLGFGRDEPDIAAKIPSRFFNACSYARGIDIKVFLSAQMQRLEVENPNFALTSRFRQIEVLTTVANAFSSLYSQVSGTPLQRIGSTLSSNKETTSPAPLNRTPTASRLLKTLSKLNLLAGPQGAESTRAATSPSAEQAEPLNGEGHDDPAVKSDQKMQKTVKKKESPLATVKEEAGHIQIMDALTGPHLSEDVSEAVFQLNTDVHGQSTETTSPHNGICEESGIVDTSVNDVSFKESLENEPGNGPEMKNPQTSTPDKEPCTPIPNPSIAHLTHQQRQDSYEMEEIQSTEGESTHAPNSCQLPRLAKDYFLRTTSQHSDSSGFAEDASADYLSANSLQIHEPIRDMGSSADSCESENTVTSFEDLKTPVAQDQPDFKAFDEEEFLTPYEMAVQNPLFFPVPIAEDLNKCETNPTVILEEAENLNAGEIIDTEQTNQYFEGNGSDCQLECADERDFENIIDSEVAPYATHHITEAADCFSDDMGDTVPALGYAESSPLDRVTVALQRAQMKVCSLSEIPGSRVGRSMISAKDLLKRRTQYAESGYPLRRTQSLPTALLSPVRVVSSVSVRLSSGKATLCSPPSFTYKYTPEEEEEEKTNVGMIKEDQSMFTSTHFVAPSVKKNNLSSDELNSLMEDQYPNRPQMCPLHVPSHRSSSSCSLHSAHSDWQDRPLCEHGRAWSTQSVPGSCTALSSPFGCRYSQRLGGYPHPCSAHVSVNPPSAIEMQLRRVLHDIRNSLQNLNQYPVLRGNELANTSFITQRPSILPLYENTFQELQVMRRSLNLFRTQMMDLELNMLRQQTMVYHQLTEEERYEADQLQGLRNNVRMELQELELQLEERLLSLEEQLRALHLSSPYRLQPLMGMYGSRSTDNLSYMSPLNVIEPVTELIREQSYLKSELGFGDICLETGGEATESVSSHVPSDTSSVCSSLSQRSRKTRLSSSDQMGKAKSYSSQNKPLYRASVALTPTPPMRAGSVQQPIGVECVEEMNRPKLKPEKLDHIPAVDDNQRTAPESDELQQVIREIKESIVGDIRREIVSGLLAAISSPTRSAHEKLDGNS